MQHPQLTTLEKLIQPAVEAFGYEYVGIELSGSSGGVLVRVYIDAPDDGATIDDCVKVSRQISAILDVEEGLIQGSYNLEVSTPGVDRKLFTLAHYQRFIGQAAKVTLYSPDEKGRRNLKGMIEAAEDDFIVLQSEDERLKVKFEDIAKGKLVFGE